MATVRDVTFDLLRRHGLTTMFANPGSTEIPLLTDLPDDLNFILALHEGSVIGMATGWAIANEQPALAILHTTAGLGNAVGAIATARLNRAPMVILVGQQDRRHLAFEPFLTGHRLDDLARPYPVWTGEPARAQDVPGAVARAWHAARDLRGPAVVIVPMDDWQAPADDLEIPAPARLRRADAVAAETVSELVDLLTGARSPALVVGAGADGERAWAALTALAERLGCPVWQEAFSARAGFPQDHPLFAGFLSPSRAELRKQLAGHDVVVSVGAPVFRQYQYEPGPLVEPGTRLAIVTDDPDEAHRSPVELAVLASPAAVCELLAEQVPARSGDPDAVGRQIHLPAPPEPGVPLRGRDVLAALAARLPRETVLVEETPSSRPDLHALVPARTPLGFLSAAMGGLGFALPAAVGVRMARPDRPVVAVVGDGASLYGIQALWSAAHYRVGVLIVVLANGRYAVMDQLARGHSAGGSPAWPGFEEVSVRGLAHALGCPAVRINNYDQLVRILDDTLPTLADRDEPLVLDVAVEAAPGTYSG
ncbi:benzoylformate decarboxylase [Planosporangium mesophilum]|uniref:Benzoylformate decarboxylase n=1 Tax=Planosporangium mesophilum TaxID=689768 RepID=A0A8J3TCC2_9ACTN|nr:benzoylformate decarboxylase [Planosporangium mesophilum]NJC82821.1 benzoylformate decarboxylase [Planosporangium mesophilum]GII23709.1 benzoylformate decarboxylase [Planosporangium mesophilum]